MMERWCNNFMSGPELGILNLLCELKIISETVRANVASQIALDRLMESIERQVFKNMYASPSLDGLEKILKDAT